MYFLEQADLKTFFVALTGFSPAGIYLLKVNIRNTRTRYEICLKLTTRIP